MALATPMEGIPNISERVAAPSSDTDLQDNVIAVRSEGSGVIYLRGSKQTGFTQMSVGVGDFIPGNWKEVGASTDVAFVVFYRA